MSDTAVLCLHRTERVISLTLTIPRPKIHLGAVKRAQPVGDRPFGLGEAAYTMQRPCV